MLKFSETELRGVMVDGKPMLARVRMTATHDRPRNPIVWIDGPGVEPAWPTPPFGSVRGDSSDEDKAWKKFNREEIRLRRQVFTQLGFVGAFSRKAGCSCGCSPGFRTNDRSLIVRGEPSRVSNASYVHVQVKPLVRVFGR